MQKVLVAGASGALGFEVLKKFQQNRMPVRALVSSQESAKKAGILAGNLVVADARNPEELGEVFQGIDVVFSAVGQSVSLFKKGGSFDEVDFGINKNLVEGAVKAGVKRFVYISIEGADTASRFKLAEVHKKVEDLLNTTPLDFTVIRPVGLFSGFIDWLIMGQQGIIPLPGSGENKTNPIHQEDLAQVVVDVLFEGPQLMAAGGPEIYTRKEIAQMISEKTKARVINVPSLLVEPGLLFLKQLDPVMQERLEFFNFVTTHDMLAPQYGTLSFRKYIMNFDLTQLPDVKAI